MSDAWNVPFLAALTAALGPGEYVYLLTYVLLVYVFAYFWTTVQFQPKEMAEQLRSSWRHRVACAERQRRAAHV